MGASQISVTLFHGTQKTTFPVGATPGKNLRWSSSLSTFGYIFAVRASMVKTF